MYILPITYNKTASDSKFHVGCHPFSNQHILLTVECPHFLCIFFCVCEIGKQNRMSAFIRCSWMDLWKKSSWIKKILDLFKVRKKIFNSVLSQKFISCLVTFVPPIHTVSFDWFLSGLEWILNLLKLLTFYQKLLWNIRSRPNSSTFWVFEPVFR